MAPRPCQSLSGTSLLPEGQIIAGKHYYRPTNPTIAAQYAQQFAKLDLFTVQELEGNWDKAQKKHFARGGIFDQIYQPGQ